MPSKPWRGPPTRRSIGREASAISQSDQGAVSDGRLYRSSISPATTSRSPTARCAPPGSRPNVAGALSERRRRRVLLPEARARVAARRGSRSSRCSFPSGRTAEEVGAARRRRAGLDGEPRLPRAASASGARRRSRSSRRAARRSRSGAGRRRGRRSARSRGVVRATLDDLGLVGWPKTSGSRGMHIYVRIERRWTFDEVRRAALALRARGRAARAGDRDEQMVEGRAPRRVPRLQPEREGPHDRAAPTRCARRADARVLGAADVGRNRRLRPRRLHAGDDAGAVRDDRRPPRRHRRASLLARAPARTIGAAGARRAGRRAVAAALQEAGRRAAARAAVETPRMPEAIR